jgi:ADP-ribosyl-[dinitrogen reductase] hydrolase
MIADDLAHALRVAADAAVEAGALLRVDFHRTGGPRGAGDHADVDAEAEGLPLTRNGAPVVRTALSTEMEAAHVVLVSQGADAVPLANLRCTAPARFRAMPSIAYRPALAAAGDAEAAVSPNGPRDWDFAGGQALLRAVGDDLLDEHRRPVRYAG